MDPLIPRIVIAGTHSGVGKTTIATGLMAALRQRGLEVAAAKAGPDFIDPGYHSLAAGRPSRNLDPWMSGLDAIEPLAARAGRGCDVMVVEGVMGLFDGAADGSPSSTADVAVALDAPVILVVDASSAGASVAAVVKGFATFDPRVRLAGVILNRIGSDSHEKMVRGAIAKLEIPVLGVLRRDPELTWRDRHLGLVPVAENPAGIAQALDRLAGILDRSVDLDAIVRVAKTAPEREVAPLFQPSRVGQARVAVAQGPAFSFSYPDNLEALTAAGAELIPFDPCHDEELPHDIQGLIAGGGFPEEYADALGDNQALLEDVRRRTPDLVIWAECGGLLWLSQQLDKRSMAGVVEAKAAMTDRLTLGYREAIIGPRSPLGPAGTRVRAHEHHYSAIEPAGNACQVSGRQGAFEAGFADDTLLASYLHIHLGARPDLAESFVRTCLAAAGSSR